MKINQLLPPLLQDALIFLRRPLLGFTGPVESWEQGRSRGSGYENPKKSKLTKNPSPFITEFNSHLSDREIRLAFAFGRALTELNRENTVRVLDFGGADGKHFKLVSALFDEVSFDWTIYEIPEVVDKHNQLEVRNLKWSKDLPDESLDISLASSSLQYSENSQDYLRFMLKNSKFIILDRLSVISGNSDIVMRQNVWSRDTGKTSYPCWYFSLEKLLERVEETHRVLATWNVPEDSPWILGRRRANFGLIAISRKI